MSEDRYLDGTAEACVSSDENAAGQPPSYIGNVANHFSPLVGSLQANVTVHLGCIVALTHELHRKYSLFAQDQRKFVDSKLHNAVRKCVRQHWNIPKSQHLLARGAHWFPSIGVLRALLTTEDIPVSFLRIVQRVLAEYEQVGDFRSHNVLASDKYLYRLQNGVVVLMIDTLEAILDSAQLAPFVQLPEVLLSTSQWAALKFWLQNDHPQGVQEDLPGSPNTLVILCDVPLISQRGETSEIMQMWHRNAKDDAVDSRACAYLADVGAMSWGVYPKEQARLLHLIFHKLQKVCLLL